MKIQYFNGGLGNQLFQYIFKRYIELTSSDGEKIWLDDMKHFRVHEHNGYELGRIFGIEGDLLSNFFEKDVWEYMVSQCPAHVSNLCQQLKDAGEEIIMVAETNNFQFDGTVVKVPANSYLPSIEESRGSLYFFGYWIAKEWMEQIRTVIMEELRFPDFTESCNLQYEQGMRTDKSVAVHIRRGDFVKLGWELPEAYYANAIKGMNGYIPNGDYFVFSDDVEWCKIHYKELGLDKSGDRIQFVTENQGETAYRDMQLMSLCRGMIIANSAFSYYAALYNDREDKIVYNPVEWRNI